MIPIRSIAVLLSVLFASAPLNAQQNERDLKVRGDKAAVEKDARWIYNDLPKAYDAARAAKKPMLVIFRCIPCEACSQFDELVVKREPRIQQLMDEFVCVRIVQANGLDLAQFQFDFDQSFHAILMNADGAVYGRYGTRSSSKDEFQDMSMEGFAEAMKAALQLHRAYPENKSSLKGKTDAKQIFAVPERYPALKQYGPTIDYVGATAKSCIHCHQIRDAEREFVRSQKKPFTDELLFPYPLPETIGMRLDPKKRAKVVQVDEKSASAVAEIQVGDEIEEFDGQPIISVADIQWVLHQVKSDEPTLPVTIIRAGQRISKTISLDQGWRDADISWRPTTWELRAMAIGGMKLRSLSSLERQTAKLPQESPGLLVEHLGWYGEHARAKNAGIEKGDILISCDGKTGFPTESALIAHLMRTKNRGSKATVIVRRGDQSLQFDYEIR